MKPVSDAVEIKKNRLGDAKAVGEYGAGGNRRLFDLSKTIPEHQSASPTRLNDKIIETATPSIENFRIETIAFRFSDLSITLSAIIVIDRVFALFADTTTLISFAAVALLLRLLSSVRISTKEFHLPGRERTNIKNFLYRETGFALILSSLVFFSRFAINPMITGYLLMGNFGVQLFLFLLWRKYNLSKIALHNYRPASSQEKRIIIVGASERGKKIADIFLSYPDLTARIIGFVDFHKNGLWRYRDIPLIGRSQNLEKIILQEQVDYVVMATEPEDFNGSREVFRKLAAMGVDICIPSDIYDDTPMSCRAEAIDGQPMLLYRAVHRSSEELFPKKAMDRLGSLAGLLISVPILLVSAIAIKIDSRGPVFFKQIRVGKNGRTFKMYKLRTMINGAEKQKDKFRHLNEMTGPVFKIKEDPRMTRVGRFLRKYSIDELPQFWNILKGDMSLVGPRPPLPGEVAHYEPWQRRKLSVKPGATCLWQINGRNHIDFEGWTKLDLAYIDNWSVREDIRILLKTLPAVLRGNGAS